jgi:hypothetical protein
LTRDPTADPSIITVKPGLQQIHRWAADEPGYEQIRGLIVEALRRVELLQSAAS